MNCSHFYLLLMFVSVYSRMALGEGQQETSNHICASVSQTDSTFQVSNNCENEDESNVLKRISFNSSFKCNDGTAAGFYVRKSDNSKRWIVYLEGGWYCYDEENCLERWSRFKVLMSSQNWPLFRSGFGILSNKPEENPFWWQANHVFVPYCTSDIWSGRRSEPSSSSTFSFMGAIIVKQVIKELLTMGLKDANSLILAGSSAGGVGVMLNLEPIQKLLMRSGSRAKVRGITDSGWFLDQPPFNVSSTVVTPIQAVKRGLPMWRSQLPHSCRVRYPRHSWKCFVGYRVYPTLSVPLFVFQWLFDEVQMKAENIGTPVTKQQWEYIHDMGEILRNSFQNVTSVFAPSCIAHSILTTKNWHHIRIDDVSLPDALHCWERRTKHEFFYDGSKKKNPTNAPIRKFQMSNKNFSTELPPSTHRKKKKRNKKCANEKDGDIPNDCAVKSSRTRAFKESCFHRLLERCTWPQCNHYCPKLQNPMTVGSAIEPNLWFIVGLPIMADDEPQIGFERSIGEELDLLELLKSFGLDMTNVAAALGIDINTLNNMGQRELISLLTQQAN